MSRRAASALVLALAIGLAVAAVVAASFAGGSSPAEADSRYRGSGPPASAMPEFSLRNYDGRPISSDDLRGRVTVLTFLDSQCTESCPVIAWTVARAIDGLTPVERKRVSAIAISTDPSEDTKPAVRKFLARNRAVGRLLYIGGGEPERELSRLWSEFKILSSLESGRDVLHSAPVRIYDRQLVWVATLHVGADLTEENLAHDLRVALG